MNNAARARVPLLGAFCAMMLLAGGVSRAVLPAVSQPVSTEHHVGKVIWADLVTPDLAISERFYAGLFGWTFRDMHTGTGHYAAAYLDGRPVAGLFEHTVPSGEQRQPAWLTFIAVSDVDVAARAAQANGAMLLAGPKSYPQRGRQVILSDPQGAVFALLASSSGDPPDYLPAPGEWIWSSLLATDAGMDAAFYQTLLGYDVFDLSTDDSSDHLLLSTEDYARASVNLLPPDSSRRHPHWLNFVRVANAQDAAAKAVSLGGSVLVEPRVDRHGGQLAVIADPSGAPIGLMEWSDIDSKEVAK